ncbi:AraC family transcriptional regulator [Streptomyces anulatus]|uniref:helix-turn-helix domain-containing protein n=1 Tax=Streptomyces anulatus TaxID=1892 RepID=UPI003251F96C|nr:AraC family transcriptional regulator [Streptomyces anulatus]
MDHVDDLRRSAPESGRAVDLVEGVEFEFRPIELVLSLRQERLQQRRRWDGDEPSKDAAVLDRVRELVELLLPTGRCSIEQVARSFGVDRRTIHRHPATAARPFSSVVNSTRVDLAERMVDGRRYSLTEIAELLSFSAPSNFSRWFRTQFGCTPSQWRTRRQDTARP